MAGFAVVCAVKNYKSRSRKGSTYTVACTCIPFAIVLKLDMNLQTQMSCVAHVRTRRRGAHRHKGLSKQDQQLKYEQTAAPVPPAFLHSVFALGGHCDGYADSPHWLYPSLFRATLPNTLILQAPRAVQGPDKQVESEFKLSKTQALLLKEYDNNFDLIQIDFLLSFNQKNGLIFLHSCNLHMHTTDMTATQSTPFETRIGECQCSYLLNSQPPER